MRPRLHTTLSVYSAFECESVITLSFGEFNAAGSRLSEYRLSLATAVVVGEAALLRTKGLHFFKQWQEMKGNEKMYMQTRVSGHKGHDVLDTQPLLYMYTLFRAWTTQRFPKRAKV